MSWTVWARRCAVTVISCNPAGSSCGAGAVACCALALAMLSARLTALATAVCITRARERRTSGLEPDVLPALVVAKRPCRIGCISCYPCRLELIFFESQIPVCATIKLRISRAAHSCIERQDHLLAL